jgi:hypothetical protein
LRSRRSIGACDASIALRTGRAPWALRPSCAYFSSLTSRSLRAGHTISALRAGRSLLPLGALRSRRPFFDLYFLDQGRACPKADRELIATQQDREQCHQRHKDEYATATPWQREHCPFISLVRQPKRPPVSCTLTNQSVYRQPPF